MNPMLRDSIIGIFPAVFLLLLYLYKRTKRESKQQVVLDPNDPRFVAPIEPRSGGIDLVSTAASAGIKMHYVFAGGCGVLLLVGLTYGAIVDPLARIIIVSTLLLMAAAVVIAKRFSKSVKRQDEEP